MKPLQETALMPTMSLFPALVALALVLAAGCNRGEAPSEVHAPVMPPSPAAAAGPTSPPEPAASSSATPPSETPVPMEEVQPEQTSSLSPDDDALVEAVFRYQFDHNASGQQTQAKVLCLEMFGKDVSSSVVHRLADNPKVRRASECDGGGGNGVSEKKTGKRGYILRVERVKRTSPTTAEAEGGYYEAGLSASGNTYFLERKGGTWVVLRDTMHWIS
jgi:hypothetical protein